MNVWGLLRRSCVIFVLIEIFTPIHFYIPFQMALGPPTSHPTSTLVAAVVANSILFSAPLQCTKSPTVVISKLFSPAQHLKYQQRETLEPWPSTEWKKFMKTANSPIVDDAQCVHRCRILVTVIRELPFWASNTKERVKTVEILRILTNVWWLLYHCELYVASTNGFICTYQLRKSKRTVLS